MPNAGRHQKFHLTLFDINAKAAEAKKNQKIATFLSLYAPSIKKWIKNISSLNLKSNIYGLCFIFKLSLINKIFK